MHRAPMQMAPKDAGLNASGVGAHLHRRPMQMATNGPTPGELPGLSVGTVCIGALCKLPIECPPPPDDPWPNASGVRARWGAWTKKFAKILCATGSRTTLCPHGGRVRARTACGAEAPDASGRCVTLRPLI